MPITRFGRSTGLPSARRRSIQRRFSASPPSIAASLEPVVEQPVASSASGACQRRLSICTHRASSSAVCGYSSLSIMFLSKHSDISCCACGSIQVVTKVATLRRALPSSISSSWTIWYATSGGSCSSGSACRGIVVPSSPNSGCTASSSLACGPSCGCVRLISAILSSASAPASPTAQERGLTRIERSRRPGALRFCDRCSSG